MASITFEHVYKRFGDVVAVNDLNIEIEDKEFLVFVGPSGCGKSTSLRMLAGLEEVTEGRILIGDRVVNDVPPKDRDIAMVFQSYALYPHMSVYDNMAFGLKLRKTPKAEIDKKVKEAAEILGISQFLDRKPKQLSGGQRQRVAVGRAIVRSPKVFLFDEPLSNLDAKLRESMRFEIKELQKKLGLTVIYVTHDQAEAMAMSDRIIVMYKGVIQQVDVPTKIYEHPANSTVADFIGLVNFLDGEVKDGAVQLSQIGCSLPLAVNFNGPALVAVRPEHIEISKTSGALRGKIVSKLYLGDSTDCRVAVGDTVMRVIDRGSSFENYADGEEVFLSFGHIMAFPK